MKFTLLVPNAEVSGGNRANFELVNALLALGHEVQVYYPVVPGRDGRDWRHVRKTAVQLVKGLRNSVQKPNWFALQTSLNKVPYFSRNLLTRLLPDADYLLFSWWAQAELVAQLPERCGKPVHVIRSLEFWGGPREKVRAAYQLPLQKVVTSRHLQAQFEREFTGQLPIIPDAVDLSVFVPTEARTPAVSITVGMMYRKQPLKRMADGIDALAGLKQAQPNVRIVLFGEALTREDRQHLKAIPVYEHILFPTGHKLVETYQKLDVFLFPSGPEEAFGLPPLEAMACGCAVVATRVGAIEDYSVHQQSAWHCEVGDVVAMSEALKLLVTDAGVRQTLAEGALNQVQNQSWVRSAQRLVELLAAPQ